MLESYEAIMQGNRIVKWLGTRPPQVDAGIPVKVLITILEPVSSHETSDLDDKAEPTTDNA